MIDTMPFSRRLPLVHQTEAAECGLACLAMVAGFQGYSVTLADLRRKHATSMRGLSLKSLMEIADSMGLGSRALRLEPSALAKIKLPAILHWDLTHYVVLKRVRRSGIEIHDPAVGARFVRASEVAVRFTGVALELTAGPAFSANRKSPATRISDLWTRARGYTASLAQITLLSALLQAVSLITPIVIQVIVDESITSGDLDLLTILSLGIIIIYFVQFIVTLLRGFAHIHFSSLINAQMAKNVVSHMMRLPANWFERRHLGDITSRFSSLRAVQEIITNGIVSVFVDGALSIITLIVMFYYSGLMGLIVLGFLAINTLIRAASLGHLRALADENIQKAAREQSIFIETIRGMRAFKIFGREFSRVSMWESANVSSINSSIRNQHFRLFGNASISIINGLEVASVLYIGASTTIAGDMTLGMFMAFQSYRTQFSGSATALMNQAFSYRLLSIHLERIAEITGEKPEQADFEGPNTNLEVKGAVQVRNFGLRYGERDPWVLRGVSLSIPPGEFVVFVGPSGGGKSTLLKALIGLIPPTEGEILIDGTPIQAIGLANFRRNIGVVMQDDQLFAGTIADNISLFDPEMDMQMVERAARLSAVHHEIIHMPMGYMTLVGDLGSALSGGQRQRVLLARALYTNPRILFLDEGTANLDPENEHRIGETIAALPMTRIVVCHRPAAFTGAQRHFRVGDLRVVEIGLGSVREEVAGRL